MKNILRNKKVLDDFGEKLGSKFRINVMNINKEFLKINKDYVMKVVKFMFI